MVDNRKGFRSIGASMSAITIVNIKASTFLCCCLLLLGALSACKTANPAICCVSRADCDSIGISEPMRSCSDGLICSNNACTEPACELDIDCGQDAPYCSPAQTCVACLDETHCSGSTPVCDASGTCRGCFVDEDCGSNVCDFDSGACVPASAVVYASPSGSEGTSCSQTEPCSITRAFSVANAARQVVKLAAGVYPANLVVAKRLLVHGFGATLTAAQGNTLTVQDTARLRILGLTIVNSADGFISTSLGIYCISSTGTETPMLELEDVIVDGRRQPFWMNQCTAKVVRSSVISLSTSDSYTFLAGDGATASFDRVLFQGGGGVFGLGSSTVQITNSIIDRQSGPDGAIGAFSGSFMKLSFSTVIDSVLNCGTEVASCTGATLRGLCADNLVIANSSNGAPANTVTGTNCEFSYSLIFPQVTAVPGANNKLGVQPRLKDPGNGDYRLLADSPAVDAADPAITGTADFDGTSRPQNGRSDLGAFELVP